MLTSARSQKRSREWWTRLSASGRFASISIRRKTARRSSTAWRTASALNFCAESASPICSVHPPRIPLHQREVQCHCQHQNATGGAVEGSKRRDRASGHGHIRRLFRRGGASPYYGLDRRSADGGYGRADKVFVIPDAYRAKD